MHKFNLSSGSKHGSGRITHKFNLLSECAPAPASPLPPRRVNQPAASGADKRVVLSVHSTMCVAACCCSESTRTCRTEWLTGCTMRGCASAGRVALPRGGVGEEGGRHVAGWLGAASCASLHVLCALPQHPRLLIQPHAMTRACLASSFSAPPHLTAAHAYELSSQRPSGNHPWHGPPVFQASVHTDTGSLHAPCFVPCLSLPSWLLLHRRHARRCACPPCVPA